MNSISGVFLIIGGNIGDRLKFLALCCDWIEKDLGKILQTSSIYETAAWGKQNESAYLNQVIEIETNLSPCELMKGCLEIEEKMGRLREQKWAARIIDIDILLYKNKIIKENHLQIPHKHLHERRFVLIPLCELIPHAIHPILQKDMNHLLLHCEDKLEVIRLD
jgi:2-amino-4-hydroxy-6-hydroxymethyldihydropteridine diphosphokinase